MRLHLLLSKTELFFPSTVPLCQYTLDTDSRAPRPPPACYAAKGPHTHIQLNKCRKPVVALWWQIMSQLLRDSLNLHTKKSTIRFSGIASNPRTANATFTIRIRDTSALYPTMDGATPATRQLLNENVNLNSVTFSSRNVILRFFLYADAVSKIKFLLASRTMSLPLKGFRVCIGSIWLEM